MPGGHTLSHWINIGIHIAAGTLALALGLLAIIVSKRSRWHRKFGRAFLYSYAVVIVSAAVGLLVDFRSFLAVVTLLSVYNAFSGYRALQLRGRRPSTVDQAASILGFLAPWLFLATMHRLHRPWAPALTWSILGGLILVSGYDLLRNVLPARYLQRTWVQEHIFKMMGCYIAITSAFAGTVFVRYMPFSAILPRILGELVVLGFLIAGPRAWAPRPPARSKEQFVQPASAPASASASAAQL